MLGKWKSSRWVPNLKEQLEGIININEKILVRVHLRTSFVLRKTKLNCVFTLRVIREISLVCECIRDNLIENIPRGHNPYFRGVRKNSQKHQNIRKIHQILKIILKPNNSCKKGISNHISCKKSLCEKRISCIYIYTYIAWKVFLDVKSSRKSSVCLSILGWWA